MKFKAVQTSRKDWQGAGSRKLEDGGWRMGINFKFRITKSSDVKSNKTLTCPADDVRFCRFGWFSARAFHLTPDRNYTRFPIPATPLLKERGSKLLHAGTSADGVR